MKFGTRLKELRKQNSITQTELGRLLGVEKSTISMYENGKSFPSYDTLIQIATHFNLSTDYLLGVSDLSNQQQSGTIQISSGQPKSTPSSIGLSTLELPPLLLGKYANNDNITIMQVMGESMNKVIANGSIVAVLTGLTINDLNNGDIVVFTKNNHYTIKRFYYNSHHVVLRPDSTDFEFIDISYTIEDAKDLPLYGKVVMYNVVL